MIMQNVPYKIGCKGTYFFEVCKNVVSLHLKTEIL